MLIELFGQNFRCLRDEFRLSFLPVHGMDPGNDRGLVPVELDGAVEKQPLLRSLAIFGPNASGKSTVLAAAGALRGMMVDSFGWTADQRIHWYTPFNLSKSTRTVPVRLGARAVIDSQVYEYEIAFTDKEVVVERLERLDESGNVVLFRRDGKQVMGQWSTDAQFALICKSFRPNALLLSLAERLASALSQRVGKGFRALLELRESGDAPVWSGRSGLARAAELAHKDSAGFKVWLKERLRDADVGVVGVEVRQASGKGFPQIEIDSEGLPRVAPAATYRLNLLHAGEDVEQAFEMAQESRGTRTLIEILPDLFDLESASGRIAKFIDEIGASLHPMMLSALVRYFNQVVPADRVRGQLVFSTHEDSLMEGDASGSVLRRDQVYFTEKGPEGASRLYGLAEFKERQVNNTRKRYLEGRYGAVPNVDNFGV